MITTLVIETYRIYIIFILFSSFQDNNIGQVVLEITFRHLNLLETAYFGLRFLDSEGQTVGKTSYSS